MAERPSPVPVPARPFQGRRAGIVTRTVAAAVDVVVVLVIIALIYGCVAAVGFLLNPSSFSWPRNLSWGLPTLGFVVSVPYLAFSWCTTGRSYGGALLGLRVVNRRGHRLGLVAATIRALLCVCFPIGLFWASVSRTNRSLQDVVMRTSAIYDWTPRTEATKAEPYDAVPSIDPEPPGPLTDSERMSR
jgi:uncharacterized RDD family membrane protein YckC